MKLLLTSILMIASTLVYSTPIEDRHFIARYLNANYEKDSYSITFKSTHIFITLFKRVYINDSKDEYKDLVYHIQKHMNLAFNKAKITVSYLNQYSIRSISEKRRRDRIRKTLIAAVLLLALLFLSQLINRARKFRNHKKKLNELKSEDNRIIEHINEVVKFLSNVSYKYQALIFYVDLPFFNDLMNLKSPLPVLEVKRLFYYRYYYLYSNVVFSLRSKEKLHFDYMQSASDFRRWYLT